MRLDLNIHEVLSIFRWGEKSASEQDADGNLCDENCEDDQGDHDRGHGLTPQDHLI
jgi:hypothetical protein